MASYVEYPTSLPEPESIDIKPADRLSPSSGGTPGANYGTPKERTRRGEASLNFLFDPDEAEEFDVWWRYELFLGGAWFSALWLNEGGWTRTVYRFRSTPRWDHAGNGAWRVSAVCEYVSTENMQPPLKQEDYTYITSTMYPALVIEEMTSGSTILAGTLGLNNVSDSESIQSSFAAYAGTLTVNLRNYSAPSEDSLTSSFTALSGTLVVAFKSYTAPQDDRLTASFSTLSGTLQAGLVTNVVPTESITSSMSVTSGTLS